ncbi:type I restriction enzyme R protein [Striga asiatica]|uniref:Type I restriction enzyme R protein n=1 Tax=Striga asiatica TaxID=4170 RepID=A0A5A7PZ48_STRAF|nr:type I restriction enzyme R protein [Striga asiatica]
MNQTKGRSIPSSKPITLAYCPLTLKSYPVQSQASKEGYHPTVLLVVIKQEKGQTHLTVELTLELIAVGRTGSKSSPLLNLLELERDKRKEKVSASPVSESEVGCFITSFDVRLASYPVG